MAVLGGSPASLLRRPLARNDNAWECWVGSLPANLAPRPLGWLLAVLVATLAAAVWYLLGDGDTLGTIRRSGVIRVGYAVEAPYAFVAADGRVTGEGPETARVVAGQLGWRIEWVQTDFDALIPDLLDDRFDMVTAGLFVTPEREQLVRFVLPELQVGGGLLVRQGNPEGLRSIADLKRSTRPKGAAITGSVEALQLADLGDRLVLVPDARSGAAVVKTGLAAALALSWPTVRRMAAGHPGLEAVRDAQHSAGFLVAAAFRPQDHTLALTWRRAQTQVLGSEAHLRAIAPFGFQASDVPAASPIGR